MIGALPEGESKRKAQEHLDGANDKINYLKNQLQSYENSLQQCKIVEEVYFYMILSYLSYLLIDLFIIGRSKRRSQRKKKIKN